jgi:dihydrodipicolinate synthase/N-acetylneuraminate lyase
VEAGIRRFADACGKPVIAYVKFENYLRPSQLAALVEDGVVCAIKYAIVRAEPASDDYLSELCEVVDRSIVVSGIGERPVIAHFSAFGIRAFTSGSVCVAPRASDAIRRALQAGDLADAARIREAFLPLEDLRDEISPLRVLHAAVALAGIAETGPALPMLSGLSKADSERVAQAAQALASCDRGLRLAA